jgi:hypothetical protein
MRFKNRAVKADAPIRVSQMRSRFDRMSGRFMGDSLLFLFRASLVPAKDLLINGVFFRPLKGLLPDANHW